MILSSETLSILKNFSGINSNIVLKHGSEIKTMSVSKTILSKYVASETLPVGEIGIYDLNEFLNVVGMFNSPDLSFSEDLKFVIIREGKKSLKYYFSDISILCYPTKDISMPLCEVSFTLSNDDLNTLRKASSTLGTSDVIIYGEEKENKIFAKVEDIKNPTSNSFTMELPEISRNEDPFNFIFNISNLKLINGDYSVSLSSKLISHFKNSNIPLEYWIALEKNSTYGS
jgi:hypothetical protein